MALRLIGWARRRWANRSCVHPQIQRITGEEYQTYGFPYRCQVCGKPLKRAPWEAR